MPVIVIRGFITKYAVLDSEIDNPAVSESVTVTLYLNCAPEVVVSRVVVV